MTDTNFNTVMIIPETQTVTRELYQLDNQVLESFGELNQSYLLACSYNPDTTMQLSAGMLCDCTNSPLCEPPIRVSYAKS